MSLSNDLRKEWSFQRFQYYTSGRLDVLYQNFCAAGVLLGYSIETSYKQLLLELGVIPSQGILNSHSTKSLHNYLNQHFSKHVPRVSLDFLDYIDDHLEARYPSQRERVVQRIGNRLLVFGLCSLSFYDDLFYQLDQKCFHASQNDYHSSAYFRAGTSIKSHQGTCFFHGNYLAYAHRDFIKQMLTTHGNHKNEIEIISSRYHELYDNHQFPLRTQALAGITSVPDFSRNFRYPEFNPSGTVLLNEVNFLVVNHPLAT